MTNAPEKTETAHLIKLRSQLSADIEAMQQKEASLREYEQRLRLLVDHAQQTNSAHPTTAHFGPAGHTQTDLDTAWEKYNRSHALLEAARRGLCDDRLAVKDREERVAAREVEANRREAWLKVREQELNLQLQARAKQEAEIKARPSFTAAPFLAARSLFSR